MHSSILYLIHQAFHDAQARVVVASCSSSHNMQKCAQVPAWNQFPLNTNAMHSAANRDTTSALGQASSMQAPTRLLLLHCQGALHQGGLAVAQKLTRCDCYKLLRCLKPNAQPKQGQNSLINSHQHPTSKQVCMVQVMIQQVQVLAAVKPRGLGDHFMVGPPKVPSEACSKSTHTTLLTAAPAQGDTGLTGCRLYACSELYG